MRFLYLDNMDIANLGDGSWPDELKLLSTTLVEAEAVLVLSRWHFVESVPLDRNRALGRFQRLLDADLKPIVFDSDPRDVELEWVHSGASNLSVRAFNLESNSLNNWLDDAEAGYNELRSFYQNFAIAEFFGMNANSRSHQVKIRKTIADIQVTIDNGCGSIETKLSPRNQKFITSQRRFNSCDFVELSWG